MPADARVAVASIRTRGNSHAFGLALKHHAEQNQERRRFQPETSHIMASPSGSQSANQFVNLL